MSAPLRNVLVIGSGKRVREAALPALRQMSERFHVRGVYARTQKTIEVGDRAYHVAPLTELSVADVAASELISCAVSKDAVPKVLAQLAEHAVGHIDLLIDTPVVRFKHFRHTHLLERFRNVWVAEDCSTLPWYDTVRAALAADAPNSIGPLQRIVFHRSAYAYHGVAMAKTLLARERVLRGRRRKLADGAAQRELSFANGLRASILEPRDYSVGHIELIGARGTISDRAASASSPALALAPIASGTTLRGFRIGSIETALDAHELELARGEPEAASVTARMDSLKRVGFLRLLRNIDAGVGAYPLESALEDTVVDYHLEKFGRWHDSALTSPHSPTGRALLRAISRVIGR